MVAVPSEPGAVVTAKARLTLSTRTSAVRSRTPHSRTNAFERDRGKALPRRGELIRKVLEGPGLARIWRRVVAEYLPTLGTLVIEAPTTLGAGANHRSSMESQAFKHPPQAAMCQSLFLLLVTGGTNLALWDN